jgi:hypothetical protein
MMLPYFTDLTPKSACHDHLYAVKRFVAALVGTSYVLRVVSLLANEDGELSATLRRIAADQPAIAETLDRAAVFYERERMPVFDRALTALWEIAADRYRRNDRSTN